MKNRLKRLERLEKLSEYEDFEIQIEYPSGARSKLQKFSEIDKKDLLNPNNILHRTMIATDTHIEIVLDLDHKDWSTNKIAYGFMLDDLEDKKIQMNTYFSGGKGWHIHILFEYSTELTTEQVQKYKEKLKNKYYKVIKTKIIKWLLLGKKALHKDWYEKYNIIDYQVLNHRHTIRAEGSRHHKGGWKTYTNQDFCADISSLVLPDKTKHLPMNKLRLSVSEELEEEINNNTTDYPQEYKTNNIGLSNIRQSVRKLLKSRLLDGKKSAVFIISRELLNNGCTIEQCINVLMKWNNKQPEQLEQNYIINQVKSAVGKRPSRNEFISQADIVFEQQSL